MMSLICVIIVDFIEVDTLDDGFSNVTGSDVLDQDGFN